MPNFATRLKRHMPKSLFGRAIAIIIVPIAIMQIVVAYFFFDAHWQTVTSRLSDSVAADIALATELYKQEPTPERADRLDSMLRQDMRLSVSLRTAETLPLSTREAFFSNLDRTLRRALGETIEEKFWFDTTRYPNHIDIRIQVNEGVLQFYAPRERVFAATGYIFIFWLVLATLLLSLVSVLFILNQARPIMRLAEAAEAFGKGRDIGNFKPTGATEVRQASQAFLNMRERILRHIDQRTVFLAGVSHDLRTPLTRLKLHLAMSEDSEETQAAKKDLADMEQMLDGYLDFARGLAGEDMSEIDLAKLARAIAGLAGDKVSVKGDEAVMANLRESSIRRAITNLVDNALAYGTHAEITVNRADASGRIQITVDDDGPGIPEDQRAEAFKPFVRLDAARGQNVKGVGLGLSIAQDAARAHGGDLRLDHSPLGGLRCVMRVPA